MWKIQKINYIGEDYMKKKIFLSMLAISILSVSNKIQIETIFSKIEIENNVMLVMSNFILG